MQNGFGMATFKTLEGVDIFGKRVLVRVDYNVSLNEHGNIIDDTRLRNSVPTIRLLQEKGAKIILMSHLGRPDGKKVESLMLDKVAHRLSELIGHEVRKVDDCFGTEAELVARTLASRDILMLENVRFHAEEEQNDFEFAKKIARLADVYVNDALAVSHRAHASVSAITSLLPSYAGPLLAEEVGYFERVMQNPQRPYVVVIGGAKISDKIGVIRNLLPKADWVLVGGATANTLLLAKGVNLADSKVEKGKEEFSKSLISDAGKKLVVPVDLVCSAPEGTAVKVVNWQKGESLSAGMQAKDIGPASVELFNEKLASAKTVLWAGPLGLYEDQRFANGTVSVARAMVSSGALSVAGGGDTLAAAAAFKLQDKFTFLSTAGGAMLEFLEGKRLPGIEALEIAAKGM